MFSVCIWECYGVIWTTGIQVIFRPQEETILFMSWRRSTVICLYWLLASKKAQLPYKTLISTKLKDSKESLNFTILVKTLVVIMIQAIESFQTTAIVSIVVLFAFCAINLCIFSKSGLLSFMQHITYDDYSTQLQWAHLRHKQQGKLWDVGRMRYQGTVSWKQREKLR